MKYKIEGISAEQLRVFQNALDLYTRVGVGQLEIVAEEISNQGLLAEWASLQGLKHTLDVVKGDYLGLHSHSSHSIACDKISDQVKIGYDMQKEIQLRIATDENHHKNSVWHNGAILHLGSEELIKIEKEDE